MKPNRNNALLDAGFAFIQCAGGLAFGLLFPQYHRWDIVLVWCVVGAALVSLLVQKARIEREIADLEARQR